MRTEAMTASVVSGGAAFSVGTLSIEIFGVPLQVLLAGFAGAVVALAFLPPMRRWQLLSAVAIGTLCASYGVLLIAHFFDLPGKVHVGIAFFGGALGHSFLSFLFNDGRAILKSWFTRPGASP